MIKMATWSVALISRIFAQASAIELAHIAECSRKSQSKYVELVKIRATYKVAIIKTLCYSCKFVKIRGQKNRGLKRFVFL